MSLKNKTIKELKKPLQQTLETILTKLHFKQIQQKLTYNIIKWFLSSPCINTLKHEISDTTIYTTKTINYMISTQADMVLLIFDLWTSRAHDSYLGTIEPVLEEFGISGSKLVSIMTDNDSNIKAAVIQLLTKISSSKPV
ncbi:4287_t:CDS:2, partial [Cetraspora pellucida]